MRRFFKKKYIIPIVGIFTCLFVVAFLYDFVFSSYAQTKHVGKEFVENLAQEQYDSAFDMTTPSFQEKTSREDLQTFVEYYTVVASTNKVKFDYHEVVEGNTQDGVQVFSGTLKTKGGETLPVTIKVVKLDGLWKIGFFSVDLLDVPIKQ